VDASQKSALWNQLGGAIDMIGDALRACPDELWRVPVWDHPYSEFWNVAQHALFWLDLHLSGSADGFVPPPPITLAELDPEGRLPERPFTREELLGYLAHTRRKARTTIEGLTDERAERICPFPWGEPSFGELLLYTMRHVQEHAAQLLLVLGLRTGSSPGWVGRARDTGGTG
jgi:hypothetical protein